MLCFDVAQHPQRRTLADPHLGLGGLMALLGEPGKGLPLRGELADMLVTTAQDGGEQARYPGCDEQQQTVASRLFQRLQQSIGGRLRHALRLLNDHHLAATELGCALEAAANLPDGFDTYGLALGPQGAKIRVMPLLKQLAGVALTARLTSLWMLTQVQ